VEIELRAPPWGSNCGRGRKNRTAGTGVEIEL
jgi:hypothetical protein